MEERTLSTKILLTAGLIFIGLGLIVILQVHNLGKLRLIFCDVGQGDAILIITPAGRQILVDGGPGNKVLECLSNKMPFWDHTVEAMFLTHPQQDHMEGLVGVLSHYQVGIVGTTQVKNDTQLFGVWQKAISSEGAKIYTPKMGDKLVVDSNRGSSVTLEILWPPFVKTSEGKPSIEEWKANPPKDLNDSSIIVRIDYGSICVYLTGDIPKEILQPLIDRPCQVLKISHHGSKTGTNSGILEQVRPAIAVIQVGKNSFGHPHKEVLDLLTSKGVKILRNDTKGIIEIDSDGKNFKLETER